MKNEIIINENVKLVMTRDEFGYSEVLETLDSAKFVRIITYNISKESDTLLNKLEEFSENKDVIIVTNIPGRFEKYTSTYAKGRAKKTIDNYIEKLNPETYDASIKIFFNFGNHSKIIMTNTMAYIGSANFSDESKNNNECGVLIKDERIVNEINSVFVQMQIDEAIPYYSSEYTKIFVMITNLLTQAEIYYEDYYWSFFEDSGHPHRYKGDVYRRFNADLSPILVEKIESFSYEIEEVISDLNDSEIYEDIFGELDLRICEEIREWFGVDSELEVFSRFDVQDKTEELFQEYQLNGDYENIDEYAQMACDDANQIQFDLIDEIYQTSLDGMAVLKRLNEFLSNLLKELEYKKEVNKAVDNT
ncbi:hypothetical protein CLPUN_16230 [Clostridium puniceum]|uniref:PLD phosphodiesterase domain-containing protein n=1 Tax=Clostridium puniceum TaxID=29367 RepID=A0A1S8TPH0_9CLOT|nr:phospholipase D-like domain-containing protein [Clostridium puniceum]OOM79673.1 hypothetical protein CLPUN_16230 [Clostridium puniceum]